MNLKIPLLLTFFATLYSSLLAQAVSPFITVDQFGYRPSATKTP
jgi:hypothetical protein